MVPTVTVDAWVQQLEILSDFIEEERGRCRPQY